MCAWNIIVVGTGLMFDTCWQFQNISIMYRLSRIIQFMRKFDVPTVGNTIDILGEFKTGGTIPCL